MRAESERCARRTTAHTFHTAAHSWARSHITTHRGAGFPGPPAELRSLEGTSFSPDPARCPCPPGVDLRGSRRQRGLAWDSTHSRSCTMLCVTSRIDLNIDLFGNGERSFDKHLMCVCSMIQQQLPLCSCSSYAPCLMLYLGALLVRRKSLQDTSTVTEFI